MTHIMIINSIKLSERIRLPRYFSCLIIVHLFGMLAPAFPQDWHQWRGPNRNGKSDQIGLPESWTPGPAGSENVIWQTATNIGRELETSSSSLDAGSPVVVGGGQNGRIFFMQSMRASVNSRTVSLRESNGAFLWDYVTRVYGGNLFGACPDHQGAATPYVDVANERLYTGTKEGRLLCLDFQGNLIWHRLTQSNPMGEVEDPNAFGVMIHNCANSTPILEEDMAIFPLCAGDNRGVPPEVPKLVALNRKDGSTIWTQNFNPYAPPRFDIIHGSWSAPVIATTPDELRRLFYQFGDGSVRCLRVSDGSLLWTHVDDSGMRSAEFGVGQEGVAVPIYNPPGFFEVATGAIYVAAGIDPAGGQRMGQGKLWKLNAQTGEEIWHYPPDDANDLGNVLGGVTISENRLYIGDTSGYLHCVDITTGSRIWRQTLGGGEIWASPSLADGKIYIGTQDGDFYILQDSIDFITLDVDNVFSPIASSVAIANNAIYVKSCEHIWKVQVNFPVPVELASFTARTENGDVHLNWVTATETNNLGFDIARSDHSKNEWTQLAFVPGTGTNVDQVSYVYSDHDLGPGSYDYRLRQIDTDGSVAYTKIVTAVIDLPERLALYDNFPNPFNPATKIHYQLPSESETTLAIYNLLGEKVRTLVDETQAPGFYKVVWDGKDEQGKKVMSGVYYYQLRHNSNIRSKKMILLQ